MPKKIVIVDDSLFLVKHLTAYFEDAMGYQVVGTGSDGTAAVGLYRQHRPDLITLDISMPKKDGMEALSEILEEFPEANVMMISAIRGQEMTRCLMLGAKAYMEKPLLFNDDQFVRDFKAAVEGIFEP